MAGKRRKSPESFALAYDTHVPSFLESSPSQSSRSLVDSILGDGILWAAVPKFRRSKERRKIRRFGSHNVARFMTPRKNLIACLDCGHFNEAHTICGRCYQKVRDETEAMRAAMDHDDRLYNVPHTEIEFKFQGDGETDTDRKKYKGKYIVELDRQRPEWFPPNLLTKGHGKY